MDTCTDFFAGVSAQSKTAKSENARFTVQPKLVERGRGSNMGAIATRCSLGVASVVLLVVASLGWMGNQGMLSRNLTDSGIGQQLKLALFGPPKVQIQESVQAADSANSQARAFDHSKLNDLLNEYVDEDGWVDYRSLQDEGASALNEYLDQLAAAKLDELGRDEQLALLINAYNAFTLQLIIEHYPLESIKKIRAADRWKARRWVIAGRKYSLNQIEHELIRPNFAEPRIHFALVCAAVGCPPLSNQAFTGESLEQQLAAQTRYVHEHKTWYERNNRGKVGLTRLYEWYGDDFVQVHGGVLNFVARQDATLARQVEAHGSRSVQVSWLPYDWSLNDTKNKSDR